MTTTHASPLTRLITPIIKPTFALFAALAIGGAWADAETIAATLTGATAADDVVVTLTGETVAVDSITAASLTVTGSGTINVAGDVSASGAITVGDVILNVGGVISAGTLSMNASNIDGRNRMNATSGGMPIPIQVTAASINARISGSGVATATSGSVLLGGDTATRLVGTINAVNAVVGGTGTTTLYGTNNVSGTLTISSGSTLALGNPYLLGTIARNYDATTSAVETDENGYVTSISDLSANPKTIVPNNANVVTVLQNDENTFGGRKVFSTKTSRLVESTKFENTSTDLTTFMVWKNAAGAAAWTTPLNDSQSSGGNSYQITTANNGSNGIYKYRNGSTYNDSNYIFSNGVAGGALSASEQCLTLCGNWMLNASGNSYMQFGSAQAGSAIAEILIYKRDFNHAERMAIESCLMAKWGVGGVNYSPLSSTAGIVMETGSTLDVGGMSQTVKSISGTGTVRNGSLTVIDPISLSASEVLTIPASTDYTLGTVAAKVVNGEGVTLYGSVQNAINGYTAGTLTVYTTETVAIDKELTISGIVFENGATINFTQVPPFVATLDGDTLTCVRTELTFVYVGPSAYSATSGNFTIGGVATPAVPGVADTVQFDTATSIYIDNVDIQYGGIVLNADVTVTGAGTKYLRVNTYTGTGVLKLAGNGNLAPQSGATTTIECPVDISGNNILRVPAANDVTTIKGKLTGDGKWSMSRVGGNTGYSGNIFRCDASEFTGTIEELPCDSNVSRNFTRFGAPEGSNVCDFSNASITLNSNRRSGSGKFLWVNTSTVTYKFGSLKGKVSSTASEYTDNQHCYIEIGALGTNDELTGDWISGKGGREPYLRKVGSGILTTSVTDTYGYILNGGTLVVMAAAAQKPVSTELAGYEVISTVNYDTEGEDPTVVLSTAYTLRSTVRTWTGAANDNKWTTAGNWDNGVPTSSNVARFPAGTWTVFIDTDAAACAGMDVLGTVEIAQTDRSVGVHNALAIHGNVTGSGSVRLTHVGLNNASNDTITFSPNLEVLAPAANADSDSWLSGSPFTLSGTVTATGRICPYNINTFTGTINVPAGGSFDARADLNLDGANAVLNINGWFGEGSAGDAKWLFPKNGAVINLNAGGTLSLCRISGAGYTLNFNGGTLTEYGAGYYNEKIIGGLAGTGDGIISLNVKSLGLNVDTATATTITPALQGDSESTGGGLTKRGGGALTLATAPTYTGATTVEAGTLVVPASASLTLGANTIVSARDANTITLAYATAVSITGLAHDHATVAVTIGDEPVAVTAGVAEVPVGSNVVITWTAAPGYQITDGGTQNIDNIRETVAATAPSVSGTMTIDAPVVGAYGNDFATVSVTAGVTSTYPAATTITYTLKTNGVAAARTTAAGNATSVTFSGVDISGLSRYGNISYTVEASGESVTAATSDATTAMLADAEGWVDERKATTGTTGSWKTADGEAATVTYDNETEMAALSDNKFSATNCSTGDVVTVTIKDVVYTMLSDTSEVDADAQGSIALGGTELAPKFVVLTKSNDTVQWSEAEGVTPAFNTAYTIVFTFDYNNNTYSLTVNGTPLTVGGSATYGIVKTENKFVKDIDFLGAGSIKAIEGVQYDAMMAVDQDGVRYATVQEAVDANAGKKGATVTLLHDTASTSFAGWKYDAELKMFIWSVCGVMFLIF